MDGQRKAVGGGSDVHLCKSALAKQWEKEYTEGREKNERLIETGS